MLKVLGFPHLGFSPSLFQKRGCALHLFQVEIWFRIQIRLFGAPNPYSYRHRHCVTPLGLMLGLCLKMWFKQAERSFPFPLQKTESLTPTFFVCGHAIARTKHRGIYRIVQNRGRVVTCQRETTPCEFFFCRITN